MFTWAVRKRYILKGYVGKYCRFILNPAGQVRQQTGTRGQKVVRKGAGADSRLGDQPDLQRSVTE